MRLKDRTAIITGGAKGIGRAIAERYIEEGARVLIADINAEELARTAGELKCASCVTDVAQKPQIDALVEYALKELGYIDILVNNAGISHGANFLDLDVADFDRVLSINLRGAFLLGQAVARHMVTRSQGVIINMSSINAILANPNQLPYAVSKGGINMLTRVMALALVPHGIRVNAMGPGTIMTDLARAIVTNEDARKRVMSRTPIGRAGDPSEVAALAAFLASDDSSYIVGQTIYPDGGRLALNYTVDPS